MTHREETDQPRTYWLVRNVDTGKWWINKSTCRTELPPFWRKTHYTKHPWNATHFECLKDAKEWCSEWKPEEEVVPLMDLMMTTDYLQHATWPPRHVHKEGD